MKYWILLGIAALAIILLGSFGNLWAIPSNRLVLVADNIDDTKLRLSVDYSGTINPKTYGSYTETHALVPDINGDSDLPTSEETCNDWNGIYSDLQGTCDIRSITQDAQLYINSLTWRGAEVKFVNSYGSSINLEFPSAQQAGCTQQQFFDDACTGSIQGTITLSIPTIPDIDCTTDAECRSALANCNAKCKSGLCSIPDIGTNPPAPCESAVWQDYPVCAWDDSMCDTHVCGDGICSATENGQTCPQDCGGSAQPNPFQFIIDAFAALWRLILSLFGLV
jgi:hypothetical protein